MKKKVHLWLCAEFLYEASDEPALVPGARQRGDHAGGAAVVGSPAR